MAELCDKAWTNMVPTPLLRCDLPKHPAGTPHHYVVTDEAKELRESHDSLDTSFATERKDSP